MDTKHPLDYQKEALVEIFSHARAYTNVVMVTGYAGLFALWSFQADKMTPATTLGVGLLIAISVSTFVGWEIYGMVQRYLSLAPMRRALDSPDRTIDEMQNMSERSQRLMRRLERIWHPVIFVAAGSAALAMLVLVSALTHGLLIKYGPALFSRNSAVELNFLSLCLGGIIAGLTGLLAFRIETRKNIKNGRRGLAQALEADLRSSVEMYSQVLGLWESNQIILFDYLDQIAFIRNNYATDRTHLGLLNDEDMRIRFDKYFRESYVTLARLRENQNEFYRTAEEAGKAQAMEQLARHADNLKDHMATAKEIADQLSIRFR